MDYSHIQLIEETFARIAPNAEAVAETFYINLFARDASLRPLFRGDMTEQGRKLMTSLSLVVANLRKPQAILPALNTLGQRHVDYGVTAAHYTTVGEALLTTLEQGLGNDFTDEVRSAWTAAYTMISSQMIAAAESYEQRGSEASAR